MERRLPEKAESGLQILDRSHLTDEALEVYSMGRMQSESQLEVLEEHLILCAYCQNRLDKMDQFVTAAADGAKTVAAEPEQKMSKVVPMGIAAGVAAVFFLPGVLREMAPPVAVNLVAVRNEVKATAPVDRKLELKPDLTGLTATGISWEVAAADGSVRGSGDLAANGGKIQMPGLGRGRYWVRLKAGGAVVREFSLSVR